MDPMPGRTSGTRWPKMTAPFIVLANQSGGRPLDRSALAVVLRCVVAISWRRVRRKAGKEANKVRGRIFAQMMNESHSALTDRVLDPPDIEKARRYST